MTESTITRSMLKAGMRVEVSSRGRDRKTYAGEIDQILTNRETHSHGILVRLIDGQEGRVVRIISDECVSQPAVVGDDANEFLSLTELFNLGEGPRIEFKESFLWSSRLSQEEIKKGDGDLKRYGTSTSKIVVARTLAGFLNTDGGQLVIGIRENKDNKPDELIGIASDYFDIKDKCEDGYRRALVDRVVEPYFPSFVFHNFNKYFEILFENVSGQILCLVNVHKSDRKVYLRVGREEAFFIRVEASTREIKGEAVVDYCMSRFKSSG